MAFFFEEPGMSIHMNYIQDNQIYQTLCTVKDL